MIDRLFSGDVFVSGSLYYLRYEFLYSKRQFNNVSLGLEILNVFKRRGFKGIKTLFYY